MDSFLVLKQYWITYVLYNIECLEIDTHMDAIYSA